MEDADAEVRNSHGCEDVEDEAVLVSSRMALAETEVDFGTTDVRMMDTATLEFLTDFLSDEEDGSGEEVAERLPFPDPAVVAVAAAGDDEDLAYSGSTRQAVGVSKSILCLLNR